RQPGNGRRPGAALAVGVDLARQRRRCGAGASVVDSGSRVVDAAGLGDGGRPERAGAAREAGFDAFAGGGSPPGPAGGVAPLGGVLCAAMIPGRLAQRREPASGLADFSNSAAPAVYSRQRLAFLPLPRGRRWQSVAPPAKIAIEPNAPPKTGAVYCW